MRTRSNTSPETKVEGSRYGAGEGTATANTRPETSPIMDALHFLPVLRITAVIKIPRRRCSGYPSIETKDVRPDATIYKAAKRPIIAMAREDFT
jgi:hypothetical protein